MQLDDQTVACPGKLESNGTSYECDAMTTELLPNQSFSTKDANGQEIDRGQWAIEGSTLKLYRGSAYVQALPIRISLDRQRLEIKHPIGTTSVWIEYARSEPSISDQ